MNIRQYVSEIIKKERKLISALKEEGVSLVDSSLDFSFSSYIIALLKLPEEVELSLYTHEFKNYDKFYNEYTEMIFEHRDIEQTVNSWFNISEKIGQNKSLKKIAKKYQKEQDALKKSMKNLKLENSFFNNLIDEKLFDLLNSHTD